MARFKKAAIGIIAIVLPLIFALGGLSGCTQKKPNLIDPFDSFHEYDGVTVPSQKADSSKPAMPSIDGSTSTIALHAAIAAYNNPSHVYILPTHSKTYGSLDSLIPGRENSVDMLLALKYYDSYLKELKEQGVDLVITPVAKEAFVFVVSADNPVNSLTQAQLRDIYSGKITNWKQVGGKNEVIQPLQRNSDSGSQTAMMEFMGERAMLESLPGDVFISMGGLIDALFQIGSPSIGYTVYSWGNRQLLDTLGLKILAVDGTPPADASISSGAYPLVTYSYSYYNKSNAAAEAMTNWLLSAEGQRVIAGAGYVGLYGEVPPAEIEDFDRDTETTFELGQTYLKSILGEERSFWPGFYLTSGPIKMGFVIITDSAKINEIANGIVRDVTLIQLYRSSIFNESSIILENYYVVITRALDGEFEAVKYGTFVSDDGKAMTFDQDAPN